MVYPPNIDEIRKFAGKINLDVKYLLGERYEDNLNLRFVESLPADIVFNVNSFLNLGYVRSIPANTVFNIKGLLWLDYVETIHSSVQFINFGHLVLPTYKKVKIIW